jgi:hypothetical protein
MKSTQIIITIVDNEVSVRCVGDMTTFEKLRAFDIAKDIIIAGKDKAGE